MQPDDPRHGTPAGAAAHVRSGQEACDPCARAKARADKARRVYGSSLVALPDHVWKVVRTTNIRLLARSTGVSECAIDNMRRRGGNLKVYRETLRKLEQFDPITDIGVRRRAQALAALGWGSPQIAEIAGLHHEYVRNTQNGAQQHYLRAITRDGIVAAYNRLHMTPPPASRWSSRVKSQARAKGWVPPLAWDNIDDPNERPQGQEVRAS